MNKIADFFGKITAFALLVIFCYLLYTLIISIPSILDGAGDFKSIFAAMAVTFLGPLLLKYYEKHFEKKIKIEISFREKILEDCSEIIAFVVSLNFNDDLKKELNIGLLSEIEMQRTIVKFKTSIAQWGSPEIINAWNEYMQSCLVGDGDGVRAIARLLIEVRSEMGHKKIAEKDMLLFLASDWEEYESKLNAVKEVDSPE